MIFQKALSAVFTGVLFSLTSLVYAQELSTEPAGGPDENELEASEMLLPASNSAVPSLVNTGFLNKIYHSWDTLYVRRYSEANNATAADFTLPLLDENTSGFVSPVEGQLLSPFGYRGKRVHAGVDIKLEAGDPVGSAFDGVVRMARYYSGYGNCVVVRHYNGLETLYGHLSKINVAVNQPVKAGDVIGLGGRTGRATCNHLHFETRFQGRAFNPKQLIDFNTNSLLADTFNISKSTFGLSRDYMPGVQSELTVSDFPVKNKATAAKAKAKAKKFHTIKSGETLSSISRRYGTSVKQICSVNGMKPSKNLKPGTKIRIK